MFCIFFVLISCVPGYRTCEWGMESKSISVYKTIVYFSIFEDEHVPQDYAESEVAFIGADKEILVIFLPINLNMCFGCSKEPSH